MIDLVLIDSFIFYCNRTGEQGLSILHTQSIDMEPTDDSQNLLSQAFQCLSLK